MSFWRLLRQYWRIVKPWILFNADVTHCSGDWVYYFVQVDACTDDNGLLAVGTKVNKGRGDIPKHPKKWWEISSDQVQNTFAHSAIQLVVTKCFLERGSCDTWAGHVTPHKKKSTDKRPFPVPHHINSYPWGAVTFRAAPSWCSAFWLSWWCHLEQM